MKKIIVLSLILLVFVSSPLLVSADLIPANSHPLERCAKVVNLDKFGLVLFGSISGPMIDESNSIIAISNNECISKGYKFNTINIYWTTKSQNLTINNGVLLIENMDVYGGYINDNNPLVKETVEYSISKPGSWEFSLQKSKVISEYNNGAPVKIETLSNQEQEQIIKEIKKEADPVVKNNISEQKDVPFVGDDIVKSEQGIVKKGFWQKVKCFFRISKNC